VSGPAVRVDHRRPLATQPEVGHYRWHPAIPSVLEVDEGEAFTPTVTCSLPLDVFA